MCYAIPGKLTDIKNNVGVVDYFGEKREARLDLIDARKGDYVFAQGGIIINKISKNEALKIIDAWRELFFKLKKADKELSKIKNPAVEIFQKFNQKNNLSRLEMETLLNTNDPDKIKVLYKFANHIRQKTQGNACCVHGIIEFSNYCRNNCQYCGIRNSSKIKRYRMDAEQIISAAKNAVNKFGFKALVLQSGEDPWYTDDKLDYIVREIRNLGVLVFLSIGQREQKLYEELYRAGARAALLRFETSNSLLFKKLRPGTTLNKRLKLINTLQNIGYIIATGFIIGLPNETDKDLLNNILLTKSLKPDMYSFGPFIPAKATPLEKHNAPDKNNILKTIAVSRLADKDAKILITTALVTLDKNAKKEGLMAGANSLMLNVTPNKYKKLYSIYNNRASIGHNLKDSIELTLDLLKSLGRAPTDLGI